MGERLDLADKENQENKKDSRKNSFRNFLASAGLAMVGNPNVDYRSVVDHVCDNVEAWGMRLRNSFNKKA